MLLATCEIVNAANGNGRTVLMSVTDPNCRRLLMEVGAK
jgi:hypothetical protein